MTAHERREIGVVVDEMRDALFWRGEASAQEVEAWAARLERLLPRELREEGEVDK